MDVQDGFQDLLVVRGEGGRGHPAHDLDGLQHDILHRGGRVRDQSFHEGRRLLAAFLDVDLDAGKGGASQVAQGLIIVYAHHGHLRRNLDAQAVASLDEVGPLVVVAGHDGDGLREAQEPFVQPVALVMPDHGDLLHPVGVEGSAEAGGFHLPPEAFAPFVRPAHVIETEEPEIPEAPVQEELGGHPTGADVVGGDVRNRGESLLVVLGDGDDPVLGEQTHVIGGFELADHRIDLPFFRHVDDARDADLPLVLRRHPADDPLLLAAGIVHEAGEELVGEGFRKIRDEEDLDHPEVNACARKCRGFRSRGTPVPRWW